MIALDGSLVAVSGLAAAAPRRAVLVGWFLRDVRVGGRALRSLGDFDGLVLAFHVAPRPLEGPGGEP